MPAGKGGFGRRSGRGRGRVETAALQGRARPGTPSHGARDSGALEPDVRVKNSPRTSQLHESDDESSCGLVGLSGEYMRQVDGKHRDGRALSSSPSQLFNYCCHYHCHGIIREDTPPSRAPTATFTSE
ncbi:unnamed protein product [Rangifer tarandus platyrhynchus]|uniref:Uncharacterized protein n=1 Tax=Rangifer tarandus platyrhynchus TaxID=3082113 RepID=A0ABN8YCV8_RANTA|nr:unnamed protein product [Rangifer tarandus platyrhynchus]